MGKITSELLKGIAPGTPPALRDRFIPYMNEAMPRYEISTERRIRAFLAETCIESMYFQATKEGKATKARSPKAWAAQQRYWFTGFFGRGIIQTTHEENYRILGEYLFKKGVIDDPELFVKHPELLEQPKWAVESACVFWATNHLNRFADSGNIFAIGGIVNRGRADREAWGEDDREAVYKKLDRLMPDDFKLDSSATTVSTEQDPQTPVAGGPSPNDAPTGDPSSPQEQPSPTIKRGTRGPIVVLIQDHLIALGYSLRADGEFGPATESLIKRFQRSKGLTEDGMVGPATRRALGI